MKKTIPVLITLLAFMSLTGCSSAPVTTEEIQHTHYDCSDVDQKIAALEEEKKENNKRILNGVRSVLPISAILAILKGRYKENVKIATGEWADILDEEIAKMQAYKQQC